jgi:hypothetical protein
MTHRTNQSPAPTELRIRGARRSVVPTNHGFLGAPRGRSLYQPKKREEPQDGRQRLQAKQPTPAEMARPIGGAPGHRHAAWPSHGAKPVIERLAPSAAARLR